MADVRLRLLIVEDHAETRELMTELLAAYGYEVTAVESAELGLDELRSNAYDVVVSDHWLEGGETGTWLLCTAAAEGLLDRTRAIMCSAERRLDGVPDGVPLMRKPIDFAALDEAIRNLVSEPPRSMRRTRAILYVTTSAASARAREQVSRWRTELAARGVEIVVVDLEEDPSRKEAEADRVAATPVLVLHGESVCARLIGALEDADVDALLDVVAPRPVS
jgi:DNA-binding NtrC family response regulator